MSAKIGNVTQKVRAIDVKLYRWAYCGQSGTSEPVEIVYRVWSTDGAVIHFGLDNHCGFSAGADMELDLVPVEWAVTPEWLARKDAEDFVGKRPKGAAASLAELWSLVDALLASLPQCDCGAGPATKAYGRGVGRYCDSCGAAGGDGPEGSAVPDYPRAPALRALLAARAKVTP